MTPRILLVTLVGGPLDGAEVEGEPADTEDGYPDRIATTGGGGAYVRDAGDIYRWQPTDEAR